MPGRTLMRAALMAPVCALLLGWGPAHADPIGGTFAPKVILIHDDDDDDHDDDDWREWRRDRFESRRDRRDWREDFFDRREDFFDRREDFFDRRAEYFDRRGWGHRRGWGPPWHGQWHGGDGYPYWQGRHWRDLREHPYYRYGHRFDRRRGAPPWWR